MSDVEELIPLEFLLCACASEILQGNSVEETILLEIYERLRDRFNDAPTTTETIH